MGHSSESLGLHRGKQPGELPKACSQQDPKFQGRLNTEGGDQGQHSVAIRDLDKIKYTYK